MIIFLASILNVVLFQLDIKVLYRKMFIEPLLKEILLCPLILRLSGIDFSLV
jgi:hypothetical protein